MTSMKRTNYWNPRVRYVCKNSAQNFMKTMSVKKNSKVLMTECGGCGSCSCGVSPCSCVSSEPTPCD